MICSLDGSPCLPADAQPDIPACAHLPGACKCPAELPREPASPQPKRQSVGSVVVAAMARTHAHGNIITLASQRIFTSEQVHSGLLPGVHVAAPARYTVDVPTAQSLFIPRIFLETMAHPGAEKWKAAVDVEMAAMKQHGVWRVVDLPPGKRAIGSRMIFDWKRVEQINGIQQPEESCRYKANLVARGFTPGAMRGLQLHQCPSVQVRYS